MTSGSSRNWATIGDQGHAVQFYSDDEDLIHLLTGYIGSMLVAGDAAIVVATEPHRFALGKAFRARGFDAEVARRQGRYIELDAADTLDEFYQDGKIDAGAFQIVATDAIARVRRATRSDSARVAIFGEMVALLCADGEIEAALHLERLWNDLQRDLRGTHPFTLCCAYPMNVFSTQKDAAPFLRACAQHTHVFPAEPRRSRLFSWRSSRSEASFVTDASK